MYRKSLFILFFTFLQITGFEAISQCTAPPAPTAANTTTCSGLTASLSASGTGTLSWYDAATGGNLLGTGAAFTSPVLTNTTIYYAQDYTCAASATRKAVMVTVNASPVADFSVSSPVCTGALVKFNSVSACGNNPTISFTGNSSASRPLISLATDNITMEIWARWSGGSNAGSNQILFYNGHTGNGGYGILMNSSGNLQILVGGLSYLVSAANLTSGIWQHVAIVRNSGTWSLYLDGTQYSVSPNTTNPNSPNVAGGNQVSIGYAQDGGQRYYGDLDEAKFWTVARNTSQIQSDMSSCITGATTGLLAYWGFNEGTGSAAADGSGNGYTLSLNSTGWLSAGASTGAVTYAWDFGDGTSASVRNKVLTYSSGGTKTVSLTVTNANNCSSVTSIPVVVNQSPTASISGTATSCTPVTLTAAGDGTYNWSGGNSTGTATNTFVSSGTYNVTVTNLAGCTAVASQAVVVNTLPAAAANGPLPTISTFASSTTPRGLAFDNAGNLFVAEQGGSRIRKITPGGTITLFKTGLSSPQALFFDISGNLYVSSTTDIKEIAPNATITATYTSLSNPYGLQVDGSGKIYLAERNTGLIKTITGGVVSTFASGLSSPAGIAFDGSGNLYVAEQISAGTVKKISPGGIITTFATGLNSPYGLAFDGSGNLFVAESSITRAIIKVAPDGTKTTYVTLSNNPQYLAFDNAGNLYVSNGNAINKIVPPIANITTVIDSGSVTLIATPAAGITIDWYDQPSNGTLILAGSTDYLTPVVRNTTSYYAEARNAATGCISSARTTVPVTVIYNTLNKNGKMSLDSINKVNKNGAVGGTGVTKSGKIIH